MDTETRNGWLAPDGSFIEAQPTDPGRVRGLALGGHEQAALDWLTDERQPTAVVMARNALLDELQHRAREYAAKHGIEFHDLTDLDGHDVIKNFMEDCGFKRIAAE